MGISLFDARKAGWKVVLKCDRRRAGLKSVQPCLGTVSLQLSSLIAALGPDVGVDELQLQLRCPGCGTDRFQLQFTSQPAAAAGKADQERKPRRMAPARTGETTLGTTRDRWIVFVCGKCGRRGEYRREKMIEEFGNTIPMPSLLAVFAHSRGCGLAIPHPSKFDLARATECLIRYDVE